MNNGTKYVGYLDSANQTDKNKININNAMVLVESGNPPNKRYSLSSVTDATDTKTITVHRQDAILSGVVVDKQLIDLFGNIQK